MSRLPPALLPSEPLPKPITLSGRDAGQGSNRGQVVVTLAGRRHAQRRVLQRHRRIVLIMKRILPVLAMVLLALLAVLPNLQSGAGITRISYKTHGTQPGPASRMSGASYRGMNAQSEPFTVTATKAVQASPDHFDLTRPTGDMTLQSGAWMMLNSKTGLYHQKSDLLALDGQVTLYRDDGTTLKTSHALIDLRNSTANGADPVNAFGPFGTMHAASGFVVQDHGARILFKGKSRLTLDHVKAAP